ILRPHEDDGAFVLEVALRSFAPVEPICLRWEFPVWVPANDLNPQQLLRLGERQRQDRKAAKARDDETALLRKLDEKDPGKQGYGIRKLRLALEWTDKDRIDAVVARLVDAGFLEYTVVAYRKGNGAEGECEGVRRRGQRGQR